MRIDLSSILLERLSPPLEAIGDLLGRHKRAMAKAKDPRPMTFTQRQQQIMELLLESSDKEIIAWLHCHIPVHLLKEAAESACDEDYLEEEGY